MGVEARLTAERVDEILEKCLAGRPDTGLIVEGILHKFEFDPKQITRHEQEIGEMLDQLPLEFHADCDGGGAGMSFLQACVDKHGNQWGEHVVMEGLFALGIATGRVSFSLPREMWPLLPGSMPYFTINQAREETGPCDSI